MCMALDCGFGNAGGYNQTYELTGAGSASRLHRLMVYSVPGTRV